MEKLQCKNVVVRNHKGCLNITAFLGEDFKGMRPYYDDLIINAEIEVSDSKVKIKGHRAIFNNTFSKWRIASDKIGIIPEKYQEQVYTKLKALECARIIYDPKDELDESLKGIILDDIHLGYINFFNKIFGKKTFYFKASSRIISILFKIDEYYIKQDKKGFYVDGWYRRTNTSPYYIESNHYTITKVNCDGRNTAE